MDLHGEQIDPFHSWFLAESVHAYMYIFDVFHTFIRWFCEELADYWSDVLHNIKMAD